MEGFPFPHSVAAYVVSPREGRTEAPPRGGRGVRACRRPAPPLPGARWRVRIVVADVGPRAPPTPTPVLSDTDGRRGRPVASGRRDGADVNLARPVQAARLPPAPRHLGGGGSEVGSWRGGTRAGLVSCVRYGLPSTRRTLAAGRFFCARTTPPHAPPSHPRRRYILTPTPTRPGRATPLT